jgi:hypothetical protein
VAVSGYSSRSRFARRGYRNANKKNRILKNWVGINPSGKWRKTEHGEGEI